MEELNIVEDIGFISSWFSKNQSVVLSYFVHFTTAMTVLITGSFLSGSCSEGINNIFSDKQIDSTITGFVSTLSKYVIITITLIITLGCLGVQTNSVIAILGAAGMAIGLALQGSLSNFAAGVMLVTLRPLKTGEYIDLGGVSGTVMSIHIFYTTLKTLDGKIIVVPNGKIISGNIINYSREPARRNEFAINVSYQSDIDLVIKVLQEVLQNEDRVIKNRDMTVGLSEFGPCSINFVVRCWSKTEELNTVYWDLMLQFKKALDQNNINIPFPQMDIRFYKGKPEQFN
ncbi:Small-conductance mechanosensitive channel [Buchnera aphidicola (Thelaxes suberi)]|uniref:small-conductance mechanosensitive channel MscS n=1 Tax=Buchnera aphidicola TaxID=9 RepID=UPI003463E6E1